MRYKVEGWIKVPVEVFLEVDNEKEAISAAYDIVHDEISGGFSIRSGQEIEVDSSTKVRVLADYEFDMQTAEEDK